MNNGLGKYLKNASLYIIFVINISLIIFITLLTIGSICYLLVVFNLIPSDFYTNPISGILRIIIVSILIVCSAAVMIQSIFIHPMNKMVDAVDHLANENFEVRIHLEKGFQPEEITKFSKSYNKAAEKLGSVEMLRKDFINNFSHEFKTPIVSIKGFAELLLEHDFSKEEMNEYLSIIVEESNRLAELSSNVLNLSKIETQTTIMNPSSFYIGEQIRQMYLLLESKWKDKNIDFDIDIEDCFFYGEENLLKQVWINIIDNAIKFSKETSTISIKTMVTDDYFNCIIKDDGIGMDEDTISFLFDKFYQGDSSRASEGNGLGLSIVKKIIELHDGNISVESEINQGSRFTIELPIVKK